MEEAISPTVTPQDEVQEPQMEIPVLKEIVRKESLLSDQATIIRDFAYTHNDPLFWHLDVDEPSVARNAQETSIDALDTSARDTSEGSGFDGAPPWLESLGHDGSPEEDNTGSNLDDELHGRAEALFDFTPEHENEFALQEGQIIYVSSRHGLGWLVAVDMENGDCGLVPEEYVRLLDEDDEGFFIEDEPRGETPAKSSSSQVADEWIDEPEGQETSHEQEVQSSETKPPEELTDEERQKIMDAAEREMALMEARMRES